MTEPEQERRSAPRLSPSALVNVVMDGLEYSGELVNLSTTGVQVKLASGDVLAGADCVEAVALNGGAPLAVNVVWGLFDGTFGAAFSDPVGASQQVEALISA